jgi:uncharacterized protein involved in outer membrane biogenesis
MKTEQKYSNAGVTTTPIEQTAKDAAQTIVTAGNRPTVDSLVSVPLDIHGWFGNGKSDVELVYLALQQKKDNLTDIAEGSEDESVRQQIDDIQASLFACVAKYATGLYRLVNDLDVLPD